MLSQQGAANIKRYKSFFSHGELSEADVQEAVIVLFVVMLACLWMASVTVFLWCSGQKAAVRVCRCVFENACRGLNSVRCQWCIQTVWWEWENSVIADLSSTLNNSFFCHKHLFHRNHPLWDFLAFHFIKTDKHFGSGFPPQPLTCSTVWRHLVCSLFVSYYICHKQKLLNSAVMIQTRVHNTGELYTSCQQQHWP